MFKKLWFALIVVVVAFAVGIGSASAQTGGSKENCVVPTNTPTNTKMPTKTETKVPTSTNTKAPTPTDTQTPTDTFTNTPVPTVTPTPTIPANTPTPTPSNTPTITPTQTGTVVATVTKIPTPKKTPEVCDDADTGKDVVVLIQHNGNPMGFGFWDTTGYTRLCRFEVNEGEFPSPADVNTFCNCQLTPANFSITTYERLHIHKDCHGKQTLQGAWFPGIEAIKWQYGEYCPFASCE
jgi:hypothetical protein